MKTLKIILVLTALSLYSVEGMAKNMGSFSKLRGSNLEGKKYDIPKSFEGKYNIVFVAFQRQQQVLINSWLPLVKSVTEKYPDTKYYELPVLNEGYKFFSGMIDGGMRSGIPDKKARESTITVYGPKSKFMKEMKIKDDKNIHIFVLDNKGEIIWRSIGAMNDETKKEATDLFTKLYKD